MLAEGLRAFDLDNKEFNPDNDDPFEEYLSAVSYAICSAYHQTHDHSPAQLVFERDMFLPVEQKIDWEDIRKRKQERICKSNARENSNRIDHNFKKDDWVTLIKPGQITRKLLLPQEGPYKVVQRRRNISITIQTSLNETKNVNMCRLHPYYQVFAVLKYFKVFRLT